VPYLVLRLAVDLAPTDRGGRRRPLTDGYRASLSFGRRRRDEPIVHDAVLVLEHGSSLAPGESAAARAWVFDDLPHATGPDTIATLLEADRIVGRAKILDLLADPARAPLADLPAAKSRRLAPWRPALGRGKLTE
jgi:hypothetical protein